MDVSALRVWLRRLAVWAGAVLVPCGTAEAAPRPAVPPRAYRASIEAAVGTEVGLLAVTRAGVTVVDPNGKAIGLVPATGGSSPNGAGEHSPGSRPTGRAPAPPGWPGLTADADYSGGIYDPDDIDDGDDPRLADDGAARPWEIDEADRRLRIRDHVPSGAVLPWIAAAGDTGWIIRDDGIWRIDLRSAGVKRMHPPPRHHVRAAAAGGGGDESMLVVIDGDDLLVSHAGAGDLQRMAGAAAGLRTIVVGPAGTILAMERGGRLRTIPLPAPGAPAARTLFVGGVDDLAGCEGTALVLAEESIFHVSTSPDGAGAAGAPTVSVGRVGRAPPGTERLACGAAGAGWVALGASLHVSADGGRTWLERRAPTTQPLRAIIPTRRALWVALPSGLWPLLSAVAAGSSVLPDLGSAPHRALDRGGAADRLRTPSSFWWRWAGWLPVVDLEFEVGRIGAVRDVRGLVCASFRLDGPFTSPPPRQRRRAPSGSQDRGAGVAEMEALTIRAADPTTVEERRALARILEAPP